MPTAATGDGSCAPSSRSRPTTASSAWARWAAAARSAEAVFRAMKSYLRRARSRRAWRRCGSGSPIPPRRSTTTGRRCWRRWSSPASTSSGQAWGVPVSRDPGRPAARPRAVRLVLLSSATRIRRPARARCAPSISRGADARELKQRYGFTTSQAQGRRFPSRLRTGSLSRARRASSRTTRIRFDPQRRLVHRAGHPLRPGDRRSAQRLSGGSRSTA